jgi:hypothetical protein
MIAQCVADVAGTRTTARVSRAALREAIAAARKLLRTLEALRDAGEADRRKLARRARR